MAIELENVLPSEIEKRSFEIITEELTQNGIVLDPEKAPVIKRCIHTSADFDYAQNLVFSEASEYLLAGEEIHMDRWKQVCRWNRLQIFWKQVRNRSEIGCQKSRH